MVFSSTGLNRNVKITQLKLIQCYTHKAVEECVSAGVVVEKSTSSVAEFLITVGVDDVTTDDVSIYDVTVDDVVEPGSVATGSVDIFEVVV